MQDQPFNMTPLASAIDTTTGPATSSPRWRVYIIRYSNAPGSDSIGYAEVPNGANIGFTNDPDLIQLIEGFKIHHLLRDFRWVATKYVLTSKGEDNTKRKDGGPVELKNGNWATYHGKSIIIPEDYHLLTMCSVRYYCLTLWASIFPANDGISPHVRNSTTMSNYADSSFTM